MCIWILYTFAFIIKGRRKILETVSHLKYRLSTKWSSFRVRIASNPKADFSSIFLFLFTFLNQDVRVNDFRSKTSFSLVSSARWISEERYFLAAKSFFSFIFSLCSSFLATISKKDFETLKIKSIIRILFRCARYTNLYKLKTTKREKYNILHWHCFLKTY